jgi:hypothetical protein
VAAAHETRKVFAASTVQTIAHVDTATQYGPQPAPTSHAPDLHSDDVRCCSRPRCDADRASRRSISGFIFGINSGIGPSSMRTHFFPYPPSGPNTSAFAAKK